MFLHSIPMHWLQEGHEYNTWYAYFVMNTYEHYVGGGWMHNTQISPNTCELKPIHSSRYLRVNAIHVSSNDVIHRLRFSHTNIQIAYEMECFLDLFQVIFIMLHFQRIL